MVNVSEWLPDAVRLTDVRDGLMLYPARDMFIGPCLEAYGEYSPEETRLFEILLTPGNVVVEVGANIGSLTVPLARIVGPAGRVHAIEPQRPMFQMLCANLALNDLHNVHARQQGLGAAAGVLWVSTPQTGAIANFGGIPLQPSGQEKVDIVTLDSLGLDRIDLIKIDVEGMEEQVLRGGVETIRRLRPKLYVENDRNETSAALIRFIRDLGYRIWWHLPGLYSPQNHRGVRQNIFPTHYVSINMICVRDDHVIVTELQEVGEDTERPKL